MKTARHSSNGVGDGLGWSGGALLVLLALVLIFHRPIIFGLGRSLANRYAARENLKIDCSLGGTIFTGLVVRNLRVVPIGPTIVESIDVDYIRADYSLLDWWQRGLSEVLKNVEVRTARIVLNPAKASLKPKVPRPDERITLFPVFPDRLRLSDINLHVRSTTDAAGFRSGASRRRSGSEKSRRTPHCQAATSQRRSLDLNFWADLLHQQESHPGRPGFG